KGEAELFQYLAADQVIGAGIEDRHRARDGIMRAEDRMGREPTARGILETRRDRAAEELRRRRRSGAQEGVEPLRLGLLVLIDAEHLFQRRKAGQRAAPGRVIGLAVALARLDDDEALEQALRQQLPGARRTGTLAAFVLDDDDRDIMAALLRRQRAQGP